MINLYIAIFIAGLMIALGGKKMAKAQLIVFISLCLVLLLMTYINNVYIKTAAFAVWIVIVFSILYKNIHNKKS